MSDQLVGTSSSGTVSLLRQGEGRPRACGGRLLHHGSLDENRPRHVAGEAVELDGFCVVHTLRWGLVFLDRATGDLVSRHDPGDDFGLVSAVRAFDGRAYAFARTAVLRIEPPPRKRP